MASLITSSPFPCFSFLLVTFFLSLSFSPFSLAFHLWFARDEHKVPSLLWLLELNVYRPAQIGSKKYVHPVAFISRSRNILIFQLKLGFVSKYSDAERKQLQYTSPRHLGDVESAYGKVRSAGEMKLVILSSTEISHLMCGPS